ncbi:MAG: hypothetical protein KF850_28470 [Labilithrix sp.]|nr:hypothetical protein [Labilithrix sp.]MBX3216008.1 hypothetical protein [Labilithrix sp.]
MKIMIATVALLVFAGGCSTTPPEPKGNDSSEQKMLASGTSALSLGATSGFVRDMRTSMFDIGIQVDSVDTPLLRRIVGSEGSVAIWKNGYFAARLHSSTKVRRPMEDGEEHNARVLSYFKDAGLPREQLGDVHAHATMEESGAAGATTAARRLITYTTIVTRQVLGVRVPESHAWAELDEHGSVVAEDVWWPDIPAHVVAELQTFAQQLSGVARESYRTMLPSEVRTAQGELVIHHAVPIGTVPMRVTYDVHDGERERSFDLNGREVDPHAVLSAKHEDLPK